MRDVRRRRPGAAQRLAVRGCCREDDRLGDPRRARRRAAQALRRTFASRWIVAHDVAAGLQAEPLEDPRALARDRREPEAGVGHHVADHGDRARDALGLERRARALVRAEQQRGDPVDRDPVPLLRHRQVAAAQPRLDVGDRYARRDRRLGAREGRVRVAVDERPVGPLALERGEDPRAHRLRVGGVEVEPVARLREPELLEEHLRQLAIPVLARVQHHLVEPRLAQRDGERPRLDELRAVADDGEDLHRERKEGPWGNHGFPHD